MNNLLKKAAHEIMIDLNDYEIELFKIFLEELQIWNKKVNITSILNVEDIIIKHFIDSLSILKFIDISGSVVDIGSGGGFPGIPIKIKIPSLSILLVEAKRKKANFLRHIIRTLKLDSSDVYNGRIEECKIKDSFDFAVSRAFTDLKPLCSLAAPLVKDGGYIIAMQGTRAKEVIHEQVFKNFKINILKTHSLTLPLEKGNRNIVILQKCST